MKHDPTPIQPSLVLAAIAVLIAPGTGTSEFHSNLPLIDDDPDQSAMVRTLADPCRKSEGEDLPPWFWSWLRSHFQERFEQVALTWEERRERDR